MTDIFTPQSNNGAACTCVVTEYHYRNDSDYAVEVELFTMDEISDQLGHLVRSYRHFYLHGDDILDEDDKQSSEDRAKVARDTFHAMFRDRLASEEFLIRDAEASVIRTLQSWAQDVDLSHMSGRQIRPTVEGCSDLLMSLTSEIRSSSSSASNRNVDPALWPYIRKIK